jgi:hypothetical protein
MKGFRPIPGSIAGPVGSHINRAILLVSSRVHDNRSCQSTKLIGTDPTQQGVSDAHADAEAKVSFRPDVAQQASVARGTRRIVTTIQASLAMNRPAGTSRWSPRRLRTSDLSEISAKSPNPSRALVMGDYRYLGADRVWSLLAPFELQRGDRAICIRDWKQREPGKLRTGLGRERILMPPRSLEIPRKIAMVF